MSFPYTVKSGDNLSLIAKKHRLKSWRDIYDHADNRAFRAKRPDPNWIHPGDVVMIPGAGPPRVNPPGGGAAALSVVPFHEPAPMLIATQPHSLSKDDLKSSPTPTSVFPIPLKIAVNELRDKSTSTLQGQVRLELTFLGGEVGTALANDFFLNKTPLNTITHGANSQLTALVKASPEFKIEHEKVRKSIHAVVQKTALTGIIDYSELAESKKNIPKPQLNFSGLQTLHVLVGAFQGANVFLNNFTADPVKRKYSADLTYEFIDHFGADDSDAKFDFKGHGSPGQIALWILQRERHPGNMPYITKVTFNEPIVDDSF
jgi:LysM domain